jgi:hypothetical protein
MILARRERRYGLMGRGTSNVLSYRYATGPIRAVPDPPRPMLLLSSAVGALTASGPFGSHSATDVAGATTAPDGDPPTFALVSLGVEPPAGIEPATPSLPWIGGHALC